MTQALKELGVEGFQLTPEIVAAFSHYRRRPNRFDMYELRERILEAIEYGVTFDLDLK